MSIDIDNDKSLVDENAELRARLDDAEETLRAIQSGEVDALVIGDQVYTLESSDAASNRFRGEVLAQINEAVVAIDNEQRVTYLNPAAERQYDVLASDVLGKNLTYLYSYEWHDPADETTAWEQIEEKGYWRGENVHIKNNGEKIFVESTVNALRDRDGLSGGLLAVIRNINSRKAAEAALQAAHDNLEFRVAERTAQLALANEALQVEMDEHRVAEQQKGELLQKVVTTQEDERRRIARDIHDQLGQRVTALRLQLASLANELVGHTELSSRVKPLQKVAERLDAEVSFLAWELRPAALDDLGLPEATDAFLSEWSRHYTVPADLHLTGFVERRLQPDIETHLYRIMQESLNNIAKHASATHVNVLLKWTRDAITLIVEDNGKGFDPSKLPSNGSSAKGLGLLGMNERATLVKGELEIETSPGAGTTIYVRIPNDEPPPSQ